MKIDLNQLSKNAIENSTGNVVKMRLSENASSMVFQLFTKSVYSNPIGTVVREITSNCFDSHTEAGITAPVIIRKHKDATTNTQYISFIDYGVGMSPDRVNNVYGVYFESTKRTDNQQIGGFGIGAKSVLAYKRSTGQGEGEYDNSFYVLTIFDNIKYYYCIYEGCESPVISLLHQEPTTEGNGTEIQIPILERDLASFQTEMIKQLYYFENIIFEGFDYQHSYNKDKDGNPEIVKPLSNDYQIIRGKTFLFRGDKYNSNMHICLGRVTYPIDFGVLGLNSSDYKLPIALKLDVGDVNVTVSRESLDYSESTIKMLKRKLEEAKLEIIELITKQYDDIRTLEQYFNVTTDFGYLVFPNGATIYVGDLIKQKDVDFANFKYRFMKMPNDKQLFRFFFDAQSYGYKVKRTRYSNAQYFDKSYQNIVKNKNLLYVEDDLNRKVVKQALLKDEYKTYYIISKRNFDTNHIRRSIAEVFNVSLDSMYDENNNIVPFVQSLIEMQEEFMTIVRKNTVNYDELEVPAEFIASRKRVSSLSSELRKQTIPVKFAGTYSRDRVVLSALFDYNMPIFYGTAVDESKINTAKDLFQLLFDEKSVVTSYGYNNRMCTGHSYDNKNKSSIMFIQLAVNNIKHMQHCKNAKHIDTFFTTMLLRKEEFVKMYFQNTEIIKSFSILSTFYREGFIERISTKLENKINTIRLYIDKLPIIIKNNSLKYSESVLNKYFKIDEIKQTKEQLEIVNLLNEVSNVESLNIETLSYFNLPYYADRMDDKLILLLKGAMQL